MNSDCLIISRQLENLLVSRNLRGMADIQDALEPGYLLRAAELIVNASGKIPILTGFPVAGTFETDGPAGAIALYNTLRQLDKSPLMVCEAPLATALSTHYQTLEIYPPASKNAAQNDQILNRLQAGLTIAIERPGMAADGHYYNMRHENISDAIAAVDNFMARQSCPTIAIGDGGNELGMGKIHSCLQQLDITPSATSCTELIVADVSNWGAFGLIAMLGSLCQRDFLAALEPLQTLQFLSQHGSVDGVTRHNQLTEDGLPASEGILLIDQMRKLTGFL